MNLSKIVIVSITCLFLLPGVGHAAELPASTRTALMSQIEALRVQIALLQQLIVEQVQPQRASNHVHDSLLYEGAYERVYEVRDGRLPEHNVRPVDRILFAYLNDTWGQATVAHYVTEFRVFEDTSVDLGAFVETKAGSNEWVVGVNRSTMNDVGVSSPNEIAHVYEQLFVHEYAHLLAYYAPDAAADFAKTFWTDGDYRHARAVADLSDQRRFATLREYYRDNEDRFVSDYATLSPEEDLAETFLTYVYANRLPSEDTVRADKLRWFRAVPSFREARVMVRKRLEL